jgi:hypothetical protein
MATLNLAPAFPNCCHDTPAFQQAFAEFRENNPHFSEMPFWGLPLEDRCAILRVAQLKKQELEANRG